LHPVGDLFDLKLMRVVPLSKRKILLFVNYMPAMYILLCFQSYY